MWDRLGSELGPLMQPESVYVAKVAILAPEVQERSQNVHFEFGLKIGLWLLLIQTKIIND